MCKYIDIIINDGCIKDILYFVVAFDVGVIEVEHLVVHDIVILVHFQNVAIRLGLADQDEGLGVHY